MAKSANMDDLFGHVPQKSDLFSAADPAGDHEPQYVPDNEEAREWREISLRIGPRRDHTPDTVRVLMHAVLAEVKAAPVLTWGPVTLRYFTAMVPYFAEWLKGGEGDRLMAEFKAEMDRLNAPVEQVAPNWREIWGLAVPEDSSPASL